VNLADPASCHGLAIFEWAVELVMRKNYLQPTKISIQIIHPTFTTYIYA
jgi:hypothetical protein